MIAESAWPIFSLKRR